MITFITKTVSAIAVIVLFVTILDITVVMLMLPIKLPLWQRMVVIMTAMSLLSKELAYYKKY